MSAGASVFLAGSIKAGSRARRRFVVGGGGADRQAQALREELLGDAPWGLIPASAEPGGAGEMLADLDQVAVAARTGGDRKETFVGGRCGQRSAPSRAALVKCQEQIARRLHQADELPRAMLGRWHKRISSSFSTSRGS